MVVPPGLVTWSRSWAGWRPVFSPMTPLPAMVWAASLMARAGQSGHDSGIRQGIHHHEEIPRAAAADGGNGFHGFFVHPDRFAAGLENGFRFVQHFRRHLVIGSKGRHSHAYGKRRIGHGPDHRMAGYQIVEHGQIIAAHNGQDGGLFRQGSYQIPRNRFLGHLGFHCQDHQMGTGHSFPVVPGHRDPVGFFQIRLPFGRGDRRRHLFLPDQSPLEDAFEDGFPHGTAADEDDFIRFLYLCHGSLLPSVPKLVFSVSISTLGGAHTSRFRPIFRRVPSRA